MSLADRPDFQNWLRRFEARHERLHGAGPRQPPPDRCDGCGEPVDAQLSSTGLCIVCLAELYSRERSEAGARIATALRAAIDAEADLPIGEVRDAVERALEPYERPQQDG